MGAARELHLKLSIEQQHLLEEWLSDFERDWSPEKLPQWQHRLYSHPPELAQAAFVELVKIDLERNWQAGKRETLAAYLDKYPSLGDRATVPAELIQAEIEVRRLFGAPADRDFLAQQYPGREEEWLPLLDAHLTAKRAAETSRAVDETLIKHVEFSSAAVTIKADDEPPKTFGRYRILKTLGRGGMGSVYLAEDTVLNRKCALKMPHFDAKRDREILERFYREAQAAARLKHPDICAIYDIGEIEGAHFISMEYVEGRSLSDYISPTRLGRQRATVQLILKLAGALKHAHQQQIVHRDLKPANIMIRDKSQPVVMDFGLACSLETSDKSRATAEGTMLGSPAYMSPEQVQGKIKEVGPTSDIYSLGVILFEMLTGRTPFQGSVHAILGQIIGQEPPRPSELRHDVDPALEAICLKMMAKKSADRFQSMAEVERTLADWLRRVNAGVDGAETMLGAPPTSQAASPPSIVPAPKPAARTTKPFPPATVPVPAFDDVDQKAQTILTSPSIKRDRKRRKSTVSGWWILGGLLGGIGLVWGIIIILTTGNGTLRIEVSDEDLEVAINGDEVRITDLRGEVDLEDGPHDLKILIGDTEVPIGQEFTLTTSEGDGEHEGQYRIAVMLGDTEISADRFTFNRDGETALTVELVEVPAEEAPSDAPPLAVAPFDADQAAEHQRLWAEHLGVPVTYTNDVGMEFTLIPPGEFMMGSQETEVGRQADERQHNLRLTQSFYAGVYEVTQDEWERVMESNPSKFASTGDGSDEVAGMNTSRFPVETVTWYDAIEFCNSLSRRENLPEYYRISGVTRDESHITDASVAIEGGNGYRLLTEAEWEYACRAGTMTPFHFGTSSNGSESSVDGNFPYGTESKGPSLGRTTTVGSYSPNGFGLHDMHGNVWEWCWDGYDAEAYTGRAALTVDPVVNSPTDGRVRRGGSWYSYARDTRSANRGGVTADHRIYDYGFRISRGELASDSPSRESPQVVDDPSAPTAPGDAPPLAIAPFDAARAAEHQRLWAEHLGVPVTFENELGMDFVLIPPGEFSMGSASAGGSSDEAPHTVRITRAFYVGVHEVTVGEFTRFVDDDGYQTVAERGEGDIAGFDTQVRRLSVGSGFRWDNCGYSQDDGHPVTCVTWSDCAEFCRWLSESEQAVYRLPREAEWEYMARAGTQTVYLPGVDLSNIHEYGNVSDPELQRAAPLIAETLVCESSDGFVFTAPVGSYLPNAFGVHDALGNVAEFCHDWFDVNYYAHSPLEDPPGAASGERHIARGDAWNSTTRLSNRFQIKPESALANIGFRVVLEITPDLVEQIASSETGNTPPLAVAPFDANRAAEHQRLWAEHLGLPINYTNSIGMEFALIPPGTFLMGSPDSEPGRDVETGDEGPQHQVTITQPFYLGIYEVKQSEYEQVTGINPAGFSTVGANSSQVGDLDTRDFPVEYLAWYDADRFGQQLSELLNEREARCVYRLPTEAQWEYACRAGTTTAFSDGRATPRIVVTRPNLNMPDPTGLGAPNAWGLFDMHGNVWEWCADRYALYSSGPATDPVGPAEADERVYRGGWHNDGEDEVGSAERRWMPFNYALDDIGFRVMLQITPEFIEAWQNQSLIADVPSLPTNLPNDPAQWPPLVAPFDAETANLNQRMWAAHFASPVVIENSIGMELAIIPPGEFLMGSPEDEEHRSDHEVQHTVRITQPFLMGIHEVTQQQWQKVIGLKPSHFSPTGEGAEHMQGLDTSHFPVDSISWYDAVEFCNYLSLEDALPLYYSLETVADEFGVFTVTGVSIAGGVGYRLPTEAEWEYACRAGTITPFNFGSTSAGHESNIDGTSPYGADEGPFIFRTAEVGSYAPNAFGLFDMHGNVREWCGDGFSLEAYASRGDLTLDPLEIGDRDERILRGGWAHDTTWWSRSAYRMKDDANLRYRGAGMRVVRSLFITPPTTSGEETGSQ